MNQLQKTLTSYVLKLLYYLIMSYGDITNNYLLQCLKEIKIKKVSLEILYLNLKI